MDRPTVRFRYCLFFTSFFAFNIAATETTLREHQRLSTSGARGVEPFELEGVHYLAVPQLAVDIAGSAPLMYGGDSDCDVIIYQWQGDAFAEYQRIPSHGNEDVEFFRIGDRSFLAVASIRTGSGPYTLDTYSIVYEWDGKRFFPFQQFRAFAGKHWKHFVIGDRIFLALACGSVEEGVHGDTSSIVYEWIGGRFQLFQTFPTQWAYHFEPFELDGGFYLGVIDNISGSEIYRWNGARFEGIQAIPDKGGRDICSLRLDGHSYLAIANLLTTSKLFRWNGKSFEEHQVFDGEGGHDFCFDGDRRLVRVNYITGSRDKPKADQLSEVYCWKSGRFQKVADFPTNGGTEAAFFNAKGRRFLAVSNALSPAIRFRTDSVIYQWELPE